VTFWWRALTEFRYDRAAVLDAFLELWSECLPEKMEVAPRSPTMSRGGYARAAITGTGIPLAAFVFEDQN
jgi:hypothetical protein